MINTGPARRLKCLTGRMPYMILPGFPLKLNRLHFARNHTGAHHRIIESKDII